MDVVVLQSNFIYENRWWAGIWFRDHSSLTTALELNLKKSLVHGDSGNDPKKTDIKEMKTNASL